MNKIIAIIGRPNVGKSTLFNRLVGKRQAIVDIKSGVTRDRIYGLSFWNGIDFSVIDTGGYSKDSSDTFEEQIREQIQLAIKECSCILFLVDISSGLMAQDMEIAQLLRKANKPIFLGLNKMDSNKYKDKISEFYGLGFEPIYPLSAANGSGTGELLDALTASFPQQEPLEEENDLPKITIVGRPNAGKSTLINSFLGEQRNIVTPLAGTTRDAIYVPYEKFGFSCTLVDTAGMRKKSKTHQELDFYSILRAIRAIEQAEVCILLIDALRGWESQDMNILSIIEKNKKGVVIAVNKWDQVKQEDKDTKEYEAFIKNKISPFNDVPILFISALEKNRIFKLMETAIKVSENRKKKIKTSLLNELMLPIIEKTPPPALKGKYIKIKYCLQLPTYSPHFAFFANHPQYIKEPYKRFIENKIRANFDFKGVPIEIFFRKK